MEQEQKEREILCTSKQVNDFELNPVWKEMMKDVEDRIDINNMELQTKSDLNTILRAQGDLLACKFFLLLPELLRQAIAEQDIDRKKEEPTNE